MIAALATLPIGVVAWSAALAMPQSPKGNVYQNAAGRWYGRVTCGPDVRPAFRLEAADETAARARLEVLAELALKLRAADKPLASIKEILSRAAAATDAAKLSSAKLAAARLATIQIDSTTLIERDVITIRGFGDLWTSGELSKRFPDDVKAKKEPERDHGILAMHVYPFIGEVPLRQFTLDHAQEVKRRLPRHLEGTFRAHVLGLLIRLVSLAVYPARIIASNPIPKNFRPKLPPRKALQWLRPAEEAALIASRNVHLALRVFYAFLAREGMRGEEARRLQWRDLDLTLGVITLDKNKTNAARSWALRPDVARALRVWREIQKGDPADLVFVDRSGHPISGPSLAKNFRRALIAAGVTREELHRKGENRRPIRAHDLRSTMITVALAIGRSERFVSDRTGHQSSAQIARYYRAARTAEELGLGDLVPMDETIPEIAEHLREAAQGAPEAAQKPARGRQRAKRGAAGSGKSASGDTRRPDRSTLPSSSSSMRSRMPSGTSTFGCSATSQLCRERRRCGSGNG